MTRRAAHIKLSLEMLRTLLGLPEHLRIVAVRQTPADRAHLMCVIEVRGPYCPETALGMPLPELVPIYRDVALGGGVLSEIRGLDT